MIRFAIEDTTPGLKMAVEDTAPGLKIAVEDSVEIQFFMDVGDNGGFLTGYRHPQHPTNSFGSLWPLNVDTLIIYQLQGNDSSGIVNVAFGPGLDEQLPGVLTIQLDIVEYGSPVNLVWQPTRYEITDQPLADFLLGARGSNLHIFLRPQ